MAWADTAAAKAKASGTSDAVGVGASISLNILTPSTVSATVSDGASLVGGRNITVTATAARTVTTTVEAGTTGGTAITPAVALALVLDDTATAYVGTSPTGLSATGTVTVSGRTFEKFVASDKGQLAYVAKGQGAKGLTLVASGTAPEDELKAFVAALGPVKPAPGVRPAPASPTG